MTGLFIDQGPVVQVRDGKGTVIQRTDDTAGETYQGPHLVLTGRRSASASEIVAGAGLGIESLNTTTDRAAGTATTTLRTAVRDFGQLSQVLRALARVPNVISAHRAD